jgi:molecular chaperone DnaK (HSP70)
VKRSRYIVGIDLGTTNSAMAEVDVEAARQSVETIMVPQLVAPGEVAGRRQLPSSIYLPGGRDLDAAEIALPWEPAPERVVGELALRQGARNASRLVSSAKSWLCHGGVDRDAAILPWGTEGGTKLSPLDASAAILSHLKGAWQHLRGAALADAEVVVTVPASFDEAARELTLEAAERAGYPEVVLLEEPQAAFYAWMDRAADRGVLGAGDRVLVFDVGGGTTDFTLIAVGDDGESFERTAVGDHLLLGGDNVDLALAKRVEDRLAAARKKKLDPVQWHGLVQSCRRAKETLLGGDAESVPIVVAGRGSKLIGASLKEEIGRGELDEILTEGFFPLAPADAEPARPRSGLQEFGLPYAADAGITRHLASFLRRHRAGRIDAVLFNGGAMTPAALRRRVIDQIAAWQGEAPRELANALPELAVARGAAYYGLVRRGLGARIRGGTPRVFYVGVGVHKGEETAVCVAPKGLEEGSRVELERDFALVTNRPVSFKLYSSTSRADQPGDLVGVGDGLPDMSADDSDLLELPPIVTVLRARGRSRVDVRLETRVTELGSLEIWCHEPASDERWRLTFDIRSGGAAAREGEGATELTEAEREAAALVGPVFRVASDVEPRQLVREIESRLDLRRDEWSMALNRALFDAALKVEDSRKDSPQAEARWLNLTGFALRPGFGVPLDEWRVKQMWRIFNEDLSHPKAEACRLAWWITWRRIAGGLTSGQQEQFYDRLAQLFLPGPKQKKKWHEIKPSRQEALEMWRVLANLERIEIAGKVRLGDELIRRMESKKGRSEPVHWWALGRIGGRAPLYGPLNEVVPPDHAGRWIAALLDAEWPVADKAAFPMASLGRRTGDRARDIAEPLRQRLAARLREIPGAERTARLVEEVVALEAREEKVALGDSLPPGLRLVGGDE